MRPAPKSQQPTSDKPARRSHPPGLSSFSRSPPSFLASHGKSCVAGRYGSRFFPRQPPFSSYAPLRRHSRSIKREKEQGPPSRRPPSPSRLPPTTPPHSWSAAPWAYSRMADRWRGANPSARQISSAPSRALESARYSEIISATSLAHTSQGMTPTPSRLAERQPLRQRQRSWPA